MVGEKRGKNKNKKKGAWLGWERILVEKGDDIRSDIYIVNLRQNKCVKAGGELLNHGVMCALTAADSVIYAFGKPGNPYDYGLAEAEAEAKHDLVHSTASFLDVSHPNNRWKAFDRHEMIDKDRSSPNCVSLNGKLFVFWGNQRADSPARFGEFYDTKDDDNQGWRPVLPPPITPYEHLKYLHHPILSDAVNDRLICCFGLDKSLYAYYPSDSRWVCLVRNEDPELLSWCRRPASAPIDNVVCFYFEDEGFTAYDISTKKALEVTWSAKSPFNSAVFRGFPFLDFIYLGQNILCYVSGSASRDDSIPSNMVFFRFKVTRVSPGHLTIAPLSVHSIPVRGLPEPINFLPLQVCYLFNSTAFNFFNICT